MPRLLPTSLFTVVSPRRCTTWQWEVQSSTLYIHNEHVHLDCYLLTRRQQVACNALVMLGRRNKRTFALSFSRQGDPHRLLRVSRHATAEVEVALLFINWDIEFLRQLPNSLGLIESPQFELCYLYSNTWITSHHTYGRNKLNIYYYRPADPRFRTKANGSFSPSHIYRRDHILKTSVHVDPFSRSFHAQRLYK